VNTPEEVSSYLKTAVVGGNDNSI